jgi:hypothetical protein
VIPVATLSWMLFDNSLTLHYHSMFIFGGAALLGLLVLARLLMR